MTIALVACKGEKDVAERAGRPRPASNPAQKAESIDSAQPQPNGDPEAPRYLRPNAQGKLVDAFRFPSVPASIVEQEVATASTRAAAAGILRRFGLTAPAGHTGEVWIARASLVDRLARERILFVSFRSDATDGMREEDGWIVFLGSTADDRVLKVGSARVTAKTHEDQPIEVDARELHSSDADDVVATWSSCAKPSQKACHTMRAWTMQRGYPELILDVTGDTKPAVVTVSPPHAVVVDGKVWRYDNQALAYR